MRILVTDGDARAALAITRSLGSGGHEVHVSAESPRSLAGVSRFCAGCVGQSATSRGPTALARSLIRAVDAVEPEIVWGVADATLGVLHEIADEIRPASLPPPRAASYHVASDKVELFRACQAMGIAVPDGLVVDGGDCPSSRETSWLGAPLVVRPGLSWRAFGGAWIRGGVSYEADENAIARRAVEDAALRFPYLVQRVIRGDGCGLFLLAQEGRLLRVFSHRRLREKPPSGGVSTLCVSVAAPEDLTEAARRWAAGLRWSGLAMLEFKRDTITGQPFLLEVNARPWGSMALAAAAGIDFPREVLAMERPDSPERVPGYRPGVRLRWWWGDVDHFYLQEKKRGRRGRTALARGLARAALAGPWPEAWDTFRCDDPVPFAFETLQWVRS